MKVFKRPIFVVRLTLFMIFFCARKKKLTLRHLRTNTVNSSIIPFTSAFPILHSHTHIQTCSLQGQNTIVESTLSHPKAVFSKSSMPSRLSRCVCDYSFTWLIVGAVENCICLSFGFQKKKDMNDDDRMNIKE